MKQLLKTKGARLKATLQLRDADTSSKKRQRKTPSGLFLHLWTLFQKREFLASHWWLVILSKLTRAHTITLFTRFLQNGQNLHAIESTNFATRNKHCSISSKYKFSGCETRRKMRYLWKVTNRGVAAPSVWTQVLRHMPSRLLPARYRRGF